MRVIRKIFLPCEEEEGLQIHTTGEEGEAAEAEAAAMAAASSSDSRGRMNVSGEKPYTLPHVFDMRRRLRARQSFLQMPAGCGERRQGREQRAQQQVAQ